MTDLHKCLKWCITKYRLMRANPERAERLFAKAEKEAKEKYDRLAQMS